VRPGGRVLGIETSCDETSAAVLSLAGNRPRLESVVILSQDVHAVFGGVVPELASRAHVVTIGQVVDRALAEAGTGLDGIGAIAVTSGPGLVGALLVGVMYGKTLGYSLDVPVLGVNHLEGHLFAPTLEDEEFSPPFVALLVSGGHTMLLDVPQWGSYRLMGQTLDDAAGEAFDKVAALLGLGYPGGPPVERLAATGRPGKFTFPRPLLRDVHQEESANRWHFSFSGLKTAVLRAARASPDLDRDKADLARGFQDAMLDVLVEKTARAVEESGYTTAMVGGGVACNRTLAGRLRERLAGTATLAVASPRLNTDNAAMIAAAGRGVSRAETGVASISNRVTIFLPVSFRSRLTRTP
jgi:N6-L-threonylcarbamoyladenine synthase